MTTVALQVIYNVGLCANSVLLAVLAKEVAPARGHWTHRQQCQHLDRQPIRDRSLLDSHVHLLCCPLSRLVLIATETTAMQFWGGRGTVCLSFETGTFTAVGLTARNICLMVITVECYFKIVHSIAHREYYNKWMTSMCVVCGLAVDRCNVHGSISGTCHNKSREWTMSYGHKIE